jgi:hypothetical protein
MGKGRMGPPDSPRPVRLSRAIKKAIRGKLMACWLVTEISISLRCVKSCLSQFHRGGGRTRFGEYHLWNNESTVVIGRPLESLDSPVCASDCGQTHML